MGSLPGGSVVYGAMPYQAIQHGSIRYGVPGIQYHQSAQGLAQTSTCTSSTSHKIAPLQVHCLVSQE